jgi:hypothetical protein
MARKSVISSTGVTKRPHQFGLTIDFNLFFPVFQTSGLKDENEASTGLGDPPTDIGCTLIAQE